MRGHKSQESGIATWIPNFAEETIENNHEKFDRIWCILLWTNNMAMHTGSPIGRGVFFIDIPGLTRNNHFPMSHVPCPGKEATVGLELPWLQDLAISTSSSSIQPMVHWWLMFWWFITFVAFLGILDARDKIRFRPLAVPNPSSCCERKVGESGGEDLLPPSSLFPGFHDFMFYFPNEMKNTMAWLRVWLSASSMPYNL